MYKISSWMTSNFLSPNPSYLFHHTQFTLSALTGYGVAEQASLHSNFVLSGYLFARTVNHIAFHKSIHFTFLILFCFSHLISSLFQAKEVVVVVVIVVVVVAVVVAGVVVAVMVVVVVWI
jgi:hypothetical protein